MTTCKCGATNASWTGGDTDRVRFNSDAPLSQTALVIHQWLTNQCETCPMSEKRDVDTQEVFGELHSLRVSRA